MSSEKDAWPATDVVVVGGGPVGLALANLLGQAGLRVVVFERSGAAHTDPRAVHFDDEIMRLFQTMGLADEVAAVSKVSTRMRFEDEDGDLLLDFDRGTDLSPQGWHHGYLFHQPHLEEVLRRGLSRYPQVQLLTGHEVDGLSEDEMGVTVRARCGTVRRLESARYAVGCDGASSFVRRVIGASFRELGPAQPWLVVDGFLVRDAPQLPEWPLQHPWPKRPHFFMRNTGNRVRWEFRVLPGETPDDIAAPAKVAELLSGMTDPAAVEVERAVVYTFRSLLASPWQTGRIFIAGDAAHLQPPFMAQGLCSGLRDVHNLSWKLVRACLLDDGSWLPTYEIERVPPATAWITEATRISELCQDLNETSARTRNEVLRASGRRLAPLIPPLGSAQRQRPPLGTLGPQLRLGQDLPADDAVGCRFLLLADAEVEIPAGIDAEQVVVFSSAEPAVAEYLSSMSATAVLIRPDRYVLDLARTVEAAATLASRARDLSLSAGHVHV